jgi:DNA-binding transcriptional MerR regulator
VSLTIGELSASSGVPIATLRDWDRRHGLSPSQRTIGNHRRYTEVDAALVVRVRDLVAGGLRLRAAVPHARAERTAQISRNGAAAHAVDEHQRVREDIVASRGASLARRDELVAERVALVARRESMVRNRPITLPADTPADPVNVP